MLLWDGAAEGGSRGGFWSNARKAWAFAGDRQGAPQEPHLRGVLPRPQRDSRTRREPPASGAPTTSSRSAERTTLGATYLQTPSDSNPSPRRDERLQRAGLHGAASASCRGLSFEAEYAQEDNGDLRQLHRLDGAGGLPVRGRLGAQALLPLRLLRGRRPRDRDERGLRPALPRLLRLGHLVAGRDRRRVLPRPIRT